LIRSRRFWIGMGISIVFLFLFLYRTDFAEMGQALGEANYLFLLPGILVYYVGVFFRSVRWRYLLKPLGNFSSFRLFPLIIIGMLVNNILPARLGIVARAYILGERERISKMAVGGTMVVEQISNGVILILFAAFRYQHYDVQHIARHQTAYKILLLVYSCHHNTNTRRLYLEPIQQDMDNYDKARPL